MQPETKETRKAEVDKYLSLGQKFHQQGHLKKALKAYNAALQTTTDLTTAISIRDKIAELEDMLNFVSSVSAEGKKTKPLKESSKEWLETHGKKWALAGLGLVLLSLLTLVLQTLYNNWPTTSNSQTANTSGSPQEKIAKTENKTVNSQVFGRSGKDGSTVLEIVETDSYMVITIPAEIMAPYPIKFTGLSEVSLYAEPQSNTAIQGKLPRNTRVYLKNKTPDNTWLYIETLAGTQKGWVPARELSDGRVFTLAEVDAQIKAEMGGKYWEIEVVGRSMPYNYFLVVNAPNQEEAQKSLEQAFTHYAKKQLVDLHNWRSHQKLATFEVRSESKVSPQNLEMHFFLTSVSPTGSRQAAGEKTIQIKQGRNGRFYLRMPLEGI